MNKESWKALGLATAKRTLVALFFGIILSSFFALAAALKIEPIVNFERNSSDFGLRMANAIFDQSFENTQLPEGTSPLFLVDIDPAACRQLASAERCDFDRIMQPEVIDAVLQIIEKSNVEIAIVDGLIDPELAPDFLDRLQETGTTTLLPMELSEFDSDTEAGSGFGFNLEKSLCGKLECKEVSYHPAQVFKTGGRSRSYPRQLDVSVIDSLEAAETDKISIVTLPQRAAVLSDPDGVVHGEQTFHEIGYSIPSFSFQGQGKRIDEERYDELSLRYLGETPDSDNVYHLRLSRLLEPDDASVDFRPPAPGAVLIIGSTALSGRDVHNTPLGPMGGMEVLANTIRSIQMTAPQPSVGPLTSLWVKLMAVFKAILVIAVVEVILAYLAIKRKEETEKGKQTVECGSFIDRWSIWIMLAMFVGFGLEMVVVIFEVLGQFQSAANSSGAIDVIWPVIGVTASAFIGFSSEILSKLEWLADRIVERLRSAFSPEVSTSAAQPQEPHSAPDQLPPDNS